MRFILFIYLYFIKERFEIDTISCMKPPRPRSLWSRWFAPPPTFSTSTRNPQQNLSYFVQSKDVWNQPQKRRAEPHITSLSFLILGRPTESQWVSLDIHWCGFNFFKNARISQARFHLIAQWGHSKGNDVERQKWQTNDTERSSGLVNSWRTWRGLMTYIYNDI